MDAHLVELEKKGEAVPITLACGVAVIASREGHDAPLLPVEYKRVAQHLSEHPEHTLLPHTP